MSQGKKGGPAAGRHESLALLLCGVRFGPSPILNS